MKYKPDWAEAQKRLTALWNDELLDRPCIAVRAPQDNLPQMQRPVPTSNEARWLDPEFLVASALYEIKRTWWGGEAIPSFLLMACWVACLGGTPIFSPETIWFEKRDVDYKKPSPFRMGPEDVWAARFSKALFALADAAGRNDFLVGSPGSLPANDLLSMQMGTDKFLYALVDEPEWMKKTIIDGAMDLLAHQKRLKAKLREQHDYWYGIGGWMPFWAPEPFISTQSDVSCMMSPEMYDEFILPELEVYAQEDGAIWYHLDGYDAKQHLNRLLSLPYIRVIQYVPNPSEPPNGPEHLELYRKIQKAGRIVHIDVAVQYVEPLLRELNPARLMLQTYSNSVREGEELLQNCAKWAHHKTI